jgi:hypothetical protein
MHQTSAADPIRKFALSNLIVGAITTLVHTVKFCLHIQFQTRNGKENHPSQGQLTDGEFRYRTSWPAEEMLRERLLR